MEDWVRFATTLKMLHLFIIGISYQILRLRYQRWDKPLFELSAEQSGCLQLLSSCLDFYTWKIFLEALYLLIESLFIRNHITCVLTLSFAQTPSQRLIYLCHSLLLTNNPDSLLSCSVVFRVFLFASVEREIVSSQKADNHQQRQLASKW